MPKYNWSINYRFSRVMVIRHNGTLTVFVLVIFLSAILTSNNLDSFSEDFDVLTPQRSVPVLSYENHEPIKIENNSQLVSIAQAEDWNGNGTPLDPFVIQGYNITKNSTHLIWISNVNLSLSIVDCLLRSNEMTAPWAGIYLESCKNMQILNCQISNLTKGVYVDKSNQIKIENCKIFACGERGMQFSEASLCWVNSCNVSGSNEFGISLWGSNNIYLDNNVVHDNNYNGIGIGTSSFCSISNSTLWRNGGSEPFEIYGLNLANTHDMTLSNLTIFDSYYGLHIGDSWDNVVSDCSIHECTEGVYFSSSQSIILRDSNISGSSYRGVRLRFSDDCIIERNLITNNTIEGIDLYMSDNCTIRSNEVHENGWISETLDASGMLLRASHGCMVENNYLSNNSIHGIDLELSENCTLKNNRIRHHLSTGSESCGIHVHASNSSIVRNNTIFNNYIGIQDYRSDLCNISENIVQENNLHGIQVNQSEYTVAIDNLVFDTASTGIFLTQTNACRIIANDIGWNGQNAIETDSIGSNYWDDGVSVGNWWSDWSGSGVYSIHNASDAVQNVDAFPSKSLDLENKTTAQLNTGDLQLTWSASAKNPSAYEVLIDGELTFLEEWDGSDISIDLIGLVEGVYNLTLIVYHYSNHQVSSSAVLTVVEAISTEPTPTTFPTTPTNSIPEQFQIPGVLLVGFIGLGIVILVVLYLRKRT